MSIITYGPWHILTVEHDGEDEDGTPLPVYLLDHLDVCPPAAPPHPDALGPEPRCHLEHIIWETANDPEEYGIPTEPGTYRLRAWSDPGDWYVTEPDSGIEIDEDTEPGPAPIIDNDPPF